MSNMPIKNLGKYLKGLQKDNSFGDGVVVDMGNIKNNNNWIQQVSIVALLCFVLAGGYLSYSNLTTENVTLRISSNISSEDIKSILKEEGINVFSLEQGSDVYEVKIKTRNLNLLLEKITLSGNSS